MMMRMPTRRQEGKEGGRSAYDTSEPPLRKPRQSKASSYTCFFFLWWCRGWGVG